MYFQGQDTRWLTQSSIRWLTPQSAPKLAWFQQSSRLKRTGRLWLICILGSSVQYSRLSTFQTYVNFSSKFWPQSNGVQLGRVKIVSHMFTKGPRILKYGNICDWNSCNCSAQYFSLGTRIILCLSCLADTRERLDGLTFIFQVSDFFSNVWKILDIKLCNCFIITCLSYLADDWESFKC